MGADPGPIRIFLSHAEADEPLVGQLLAHLSVLGSEGLAQVTHRRAVGAGEVSDQAVAALLAEAQVILLLLSADYNATRDCYQVELAEALRRHQAGTACVLPIRLRPFDAEGAPYAHLAALPRRRPSVKEFADPDAAWEEIARAVRQVVLSLREGRRPVVGGVDPAADPEYAQLHGYVRPGGRALSCDRYAQWGKTVDLCADPGSLAVVVPGPVRHGHTYFLLRVEIGLPRDPPREIVRVHFRFRPFPRYAAEYRADLSRSLGCSEEGLDLELSRRLSRGHLVLLHDPIDRAPAGDDPAPLRSCFTDWLPDLFEKAHAPRSIKCIQPIVFLPDRRLAFLRRREAGDRALRRAGARTLIAALRGLSGRMPVHVLDDLSRIDKEHVRDFYKRACLPPGRRDEFVRVVMAGEQTPEAILRSILEYLPQFEGAPG